jgi:hypothetical protein
VTRLDPPEIAIKEGEDRSIKRGLGVAGRQLQGMARRTEWRLVGYSDEETGGITLEAQSEGAWLVEFNEEIDTTFGISSRYDSEGLKRACTAKRDRGWQV